MVSGRHRTVRPGKYHEPLLFILLLCPLIFAKLHVAVPSRRIAAPGSRARYKPTIQSYRHINIQQRTLADEGPTEPTEDGGENFVRKESLQVEIQDKLHYEYNVAPDPESPTFTSPRTFAEAAMSTRYRIRGGRKDSLKDRDDATLSGPMSLESLGPFKYTFKKKKKPNKWSPFDISMADSTSEVGSSSEVDVSSSRAVSPNPRMLFGPCPASSPTSPQRYSSTLAIASVSPHEIRGKGRYVVEDAEKDTDFDDIGETHQTPTQSNFSFSALVSAAPQPPCSSVDTGASPPCIDYSSDQAESDSSDTHSTKGRTSAAMTSIAEAFNAKKALKLKAKAAQDLFDSVEWDPDLPSVTSAPVSPAPVIAPPQQLAYTTVGSLVNPNVVPQFTAPNRIQREGPGRRPLMTFIQNRPLMPSRHLEPSYFHPRDVPPPLGMQNSMYYAQQPTQSPVRGYQAPQPTSSHSSHSTKSLQQMSLTDEEMKVVKNVGGPQMLSGNIAGVSNTCNKLSASTEQGENKKPSGEPSSPKVLQNNKDVILPTLSPSDLVDDPLRRSSTLSTTLSGLQKMQTIQRLAKFENPMQELARSRLSALSISNCLGRTVANPRGLSTSSSLEPDSMSNKGAVSKQGELDRSYQFPPGFGNSTMSQTNPLTAYGASAFRVPPAIRSGIPQPLTAGPPGQRQYLGGIASKSNQTFNDSRQLGGEVNNFSTSYDDYLCNNNNSDPRMKFSSLRASQQTITSPPSQTFSMGTTQQPSSIQQTRLAAFEGEIVGSKLVDSLPNSAVSKYYPNGLPSDMDGSFKPLSYDMMVKMGQISGVQIPGTPREKLEARTKELEDWWYSGQKNWGKTTDDHIHDMEVREDARGKTPFEAIGPPPSNALQKMAISEEEMKNITTAGAAIPIIDAAFGALLAYADETSESRRYLSGFETSPEFLIDSSDKGNLSFFGEDWGAPPKRVGGDRRYQSAFHSPSTTHWE